MRLTLRTLLAYLDEVLEPADAQGIGKKIEESEFAANIVHRTRDVMRRLRLGAPKLGGKGMGLDPNTVAEYLDNTLPEDRVADFEKVCLESDVHLAEVASCHQIIVLVLGEPAEVDAASREKMYKLIDRAPTSPPVTAAAPAAAKPVAKPAPPPAIQPALGVAGNAAATARKKPEVPDYLREPERRRPWGVAAAVALLAAMFIVVLLMAIPGENGSWLSRQFGFGGKPVGDNQVALDSGGSAKATDDADNEANGNETQPAASGTELKQPESVAAPKQPSEPAEPVDTVPPSPAPAPTPIRVEPPLPGTAPASTVATTPPGEPAPAPAPANTNTTEIPKPPEPVAPKPAAVASTNKPVEPVIKPDPAKPDPVKSEPAKPAEVPADSVGRLISNGQVLVRLDSKTGAWQRLPVQQTLLAADRLISLPAFRSIMTLFSGVTVELLGGSAATLEPPADGVPGLHLEFGRAVVLSSGKPDAKLRVRVGDRAALVSFNDPDTTMALEVRPVRVEGSDPEMQEPKLIIELYAANGKLTWQELPDGKPEIVESATRVSLGAKGVKSTELPDWIKEERLTNPEIIGAKFMSDYLDASNSTMLGLKELADHRRAEVRHLAVRGLAVLGEVDPLVAALNQNDPAQKTAWLEQVPQLREAIAHGPNMAAAVRKSFEKQRGESAAALYRMLWGYTSADLKAGADVKLVDALDHSDMDFRALAIWNLTNLTGQTTLSYSPHLTGDARRMAVQKWRQRQASGQIVIKPEVD